MLWFRTQRVAIVALLVLPLVLIIVLLLPVWFCLPFCESGRAFILELISSFTQWLSEVKAVVAGDQTTPAGLPSTN